MTLDTAPNIARAVKPNFLSRQLTMACPLCHEQKRQAFDVLRQATKLRKIDVVYVMSIISILLWPFHWYTAPITDGVNLLAVKASEVPGLTYALYPFSMHSLLRTQLQIGHVAEAQDACTGQDPEGEPRSRPRES